MQNETCYRIKNIAYAKDNSAILENLLLAYEEAIRILTQSISLSDATNSFLSSLSTRNMK